MITRSTEQSSSSFLRNVHFRSAKYCIHVSKSETPLKRSSFPHPFLSIDVRRDISWIMNIIYLCKYLGKRYAEKVICQSMHKHQRLKDSGLYFIFFYKSFLRLIKANAVSTTNTAPVIMHIAPRPLPASLFVASRNAPPAAT